MHSTNTAKVFILYTGGTIGMAPADPNKVGSPLVPKPLAELLEYLGGLSKDERFDLEYEGFESPLDSSNVGPANWIDMARRIGRVYDKFDGFVILHGTDTLAYTASALSFMFENLAKPVIVTGSQLPISGTRTDAIMNFVNAVYVAGYKATGLPCIPEVAVVFADKILRGCRTRKVSASSWAGFNSPNFKPLGSIGEYIDIDTKLLRPMPAAGQVFQVNEELNTKVMDLGLTPGFRPNLLEHIFSAKDVDAIVLRTYGAGNAPDNLLDAIAEVNRHQKTVINVTQCMEGTVEMGLYAASSGLLERGVISALDMTPEAALTKLMWTLATKMGGQVITQMQVNQRGEQSQNLFDLRYGKCASKAEPEAKFAHFVTPDRRLEVNRLSRAVVRFSGLGVAGVPSGETARVRVFMNMPSATAETPASHPRCVAQIEFEWKGDAVNLAHVADDVQVKSVVGEGDITLSVVADPGVTFWFGGLYLAVFAHA